MRVFAESDADLGPQRPRQPAREPEMISFVVHEDRSAWNPCRDAASAAILLLTTFEGATTACNRRDRREREREREREGGLDSSSPLFGEWIAVVWTLTKKRYERESQRRGNR